MKAKRYFVIPNLNYTGNTGGGLRRQLDVYLPRETGEPVPLIMVIHGGGWNSGDKGALGGEAFFLDHGFGLARINYRYSSQAVHPAQLEDCRAALRFLRAHSGDLGIDPNRITGIGHSAGGHLVSLLACTAFQAPGTQLCGVVNQAGPTDFPELLRLRNAGQTQDPEDYALQSFEKLLGHTVAENPENTRLAGPIAYVNAGHRPCPHLLIYGGEDPIVPPSQGELFHQAMQKIGGESQFHTIPGAGHVDPRFWQEENFLRVLAFLQRVIGGGGSLRS